MHRSSARQITACAGRYDEPAQAADLVLTSDEVDSLSAGER
jgi:hypothetical protein